jgi:hypothetical protein
MLPVTDYSRGHIILNAGVFVLQPSPSNGPILLIDHMLDEFLQFWSFMLQLVGEDQATEAGTDGYNSELLRFICSLVDHGNAYVGELTY